MFLLRSTCRSSITNLASLTFNCNHPTLVAPSWLEVDPKRKTEVRSGAHDPKLKRRHKSRLLPLCDTRTGHPHGIPESAARRETERALVRIDLMILPINKRHTQIGDRVPSNNTPL